jgi:hypothetical protein
LEELVPQQNPVPVRSVVKVRTRALPNPVADNVQIRQRVHAELRIQQRVHADGHDHDDSSMAKYCITV